MIGGQTSAGYLATVEAYDLVTNFWVPPERRCPRPGRGSAWAR